MSSESKPLRLARYLKEFVALRGSVVRDIAKYESVLWFGDIPQERECTSPAWNDDAESDGHWLKVQKQEFPKRPNPPDIILPWIDEQALKQATAEIPSLRAIRMAPAPEAEKMDQADAPMIEQHLSDHPEVVAAYHRYRPNWELWSQEFRRRSRIQAVYADLFRIHTQLRKQGELFELVLGLGLLAWRGSLKGKSVPILRHVVTAQVELHFDAASGLIRLECAANGARLRIEDDMLEPESRPPRNFYSGVSEQLDEIGDDVWDRPRLFSALKAWAGALHADLEWSPDLKPLSAVEGKPMVSFAPALILRSRTQAGMARIYEAIINRLTNEDESVPPGWGGLVDDVDDQDGPHIPAGPPDADTNSPRSPQETYFPLPANREQRKIVDAIDRRRGALVQGPPGTGKSHTIANLMCHLLATGKKVLITAETGRALQVLKEKLPKEVQPLCVSLLGQGGDAFAELNASVQGITSRYAGWAPGAYDVRISEIDQELALARRALAKTDSELRSLRQDETLVHNLLNGTYQGTASAIAERVTQERSRFQWLQLPQRSEGDSPITSDSMIDWLKILRRHDTSSIAQSTLRTVGSETLPTPEDFSAAVVSERDAQSAVNQIADLRKRDAYKPIITLGADERKRLSTALKGLDERRVKFSRFQYSWVHTAIKETLEARPAQWRALLDHSNELAKIIDQSAGALGTHTVIIPEDRVTAAVRADVVAAIDHLRSGGKWAVFGIFTPKAVKDRLYLRDQIKVDGEAPNNPERLEIVQHHLSLSLALRELEGMWHDHGGVPKAAQIRIRLAAINEHIALLAEVLHFADSCSRLADEFAATSPPIPEPNWFSTQTREWLAIFDAAVIEVVHGNAVDRINACLVSIDAVRSLHDSHPVNALLADAVRTRDVAGYSRAYDQIRSIESTRRDQTLRQRIERTIDDLIPGLVKAVESSILDSAWDLRFRDWTPAWRWAIADNWLRKRTDFSYQLQLSESHRSINATIGGLLSETTALRAWTHFFKRLTTKEAAALKGWRETVKAMGKGTGRSAKTERLRREARRYMDQCREAIPVWIMPRYLVAEMIDPAPGKYDLVIVDEASQLGIESLFLFYIAKKLIVVGDDQQISPYGVGVADEAIASLQQHFLEGVPHQNALSAQSSLYGNARIRFGQNIVLREHFRCMPEIIQFSNDLCYASNGTPLDPLRAYPANRLMPLVLRHVPEGFRTGSPQNAVNEPEADAVVRQVIACIGDARYAGRTMGVISLQGDAQARLIEHKLLSVIEPEVIEEKRLICGDAYAFQGDERHVIFLSMVAAPNERIGALANESARQRFNVAASRAQDQLWLFHSVSLDVLSPSCMRHRLLDYMTNPKRAADNVANAKFESNLERDVYEITAAKGFHVRTQVCIGDPTNHRYRIDLVVEGMQGRLGVECDGDRWHGADRYDQDMARQRDLERAGWQFVRIRGGEFYRDREKAMEPLWAELDRLGIRPGGIDEAAAEPPAPADVQSRPDDEVDISEYENADELPLTSHHTKRVDLADAIEVTSPTFINGKRGTSIGSDLREQSRRPSSQQGSTQEKRTSPRALGNLVAEEYVAFQGPAGDDPRTIGSEQVADGLCRIVSVEGPMIAKRAYDIYLRGCGVQRMGGELKRTMNKALASAIRQGRIISADETSNGGYLYSVIRTKDSSAVKVRTRGPRTFEEIPLSELQVVALKVGEIEHVELGSDEHLRAVLEWYDLKRLTAQVGVTLLEVLEKKFEHSERLIEPA